MWRTCASSSGIGDGWDSLEGDGGSEETNDGDDNGDDWIFVIDHDFAEARAAVGGASGSGQGRGAASAPPCWVCRGSGRTSKWLGAAAVKAAAEKMAAEDWGAAYQCSLCTEDGLYGMSTSCSKHFFCGACLASTMAGAFAKKQFPPHCPQCFLDAGGEKTEVGTVDDGALSFLTHRGILSKTFLFNFLDAAAAAAAAGTTAGDGVAGPAGMARSSASASFQCPAQCGRFLLPQHPSYAGLEPGLPVQGEGAGAGIRLGACPCGALVCVACQKVQSEPGIHTCQRDLGSGDGGGGGHKAGATSSAAAGKNVLVPAATAAKPCPACGKEVQNATPEIDSAMCGRAGSRGGYQEAVANGGCGYIFSWNTLRGADDQRGFLDPAGVWVQGRTPTENSSGASNGGEDMVLGSYYAGGMKRMASSQSRLAAMRLSENGASTYDADLGDDAEANELL